MNYDIIIVGGGAAGFFTAINAAEHNPELKIAILERGKQVLSKVKISGGGRCNVTHAEFVPNILSKNYPRGEKELKGPFHSFMTGDTMEWFENRGVELKIEDDGRVFPVSDSSETIINCFLSECKKQDISILKNHSVKDFTAVDQGWKIITNQGDYYAKKLMIATGSSTKIWKVLKELGHHIIDPVPSLFTFNSKDSRIKNLPGLVTNATVSVLNTKLKSEGPLLITHWGMSGPAILKLSAWGAIELNALEYSFKIRINWLPGYSQQEILEELKQIKEVSAKKQVYRYTQFDIPKRLWQSLLIAATIKKEMRWADLSKIQMVKLSEELIQGVFDIKGKSTFKEELF